MKELRKLAAASLLVLVAILLTLKFKAALGWAPDLLVPAFATAGFLLDIYPLAGLVLVALWILKWQAGVPVEIWLLAGVPLAAWAGKRFLPSSPWLTLAAVIAVGELAIYGVADGSVFGKSLDLILPNVIFAVILGVSLKALLEWVHEEG